MEIAQFASYRLEVGGAVASVGATACVTVNVIYFHACGALVPSYEQRNDLTRIVPMTVDPRRAFRAAPAEVSAVAHVVVIVQAAVAATALIGADLAAW